MTKHEFFEILKNRKVLTSIIVSAIFNNIVAYMLGLNVVDNFIPFILLSLVGSTLVVILVFWDDIQGINHD